MDTMKQSPDLSAPVSPSEEMKSPQNGISKIPTSILVNEITEIENDESPNRKEIKKDPQHMGF